MKGFLSVFLALSLGVFTNPAAAKQQCSALTCDASGSDCEERTCTMYEPGDKMEADSAKGYMISCPNCKLNYLHDVRRWLREEQVWKTYKDLDMKWHQGHNPDLVITKEGGGEERIDLSSYNFDGITKLLDEKGFARKG